MIFLALSDISISIEFEELKRNYDNFIRPFKPIVRNEKCNIFYNLINEKRTKRDMVEMAQSTRPFLAKEIYNLLEEFMSFMGNLPGEEGLNYQAVYENFTPNCLIKRLIFKRPVVFLMRNDKCVLRWNGEKLIEGCHMHYNVAKNLNKVDDSPYLREYISYDENLMSSLIGMSTPTFYVSDGSLKNRNEKSQKAFINRGILCGIVGARNTKWGFMENRFVFPRSSEISTNVHKSDDFWIKKVFSEAFPEGKIPLKKEISLKPEIYGSIYEADVNVVYLEKRLMLSILPYIQEAISRGHEMKQDIFCAVPAIGGGVWRGKVNPDIIIKLIITGVLKFLDENFSYETFHPLKALALPKFPIVNFYMSFKPKNRIKEIKIQENDKISIIFKEPHDHEIIIFNKFRYVAEPLPENFENCLSIAAYAWDGNSYPGNEYWIGCLGSFDPQAIFCSLLGQFQNPEINTKICDAERIKIY